MPLVFSVTIVPSGNRRSAIFSSSPPRFVSRAMRSSCAANGARSSAHLRSRNAKPKRWHAQPMMGMRRSDALRAM